VATNVPDVSPPQSVPLMVNVPFIVEKLLASVPVRVKAVFELMVAANDVLSEMTSWDAVTLTGTLGEMQGRPAKREMPFAVSYRPVRANDD